MFWICLTVVCLAPLIWPGDSTWICDEPLFIGRAQRYNRVPKQYLGIDLPFTITPRGLLSSRRIFYGPLPIWIYQGMVIVSHNPLVLVMIHAVLMTASNALALVWLGRSLGLNPWFVPVVFLSPWFWIYDRVLWDTFEIPLTTLLLAAYASFLATRKVLGFRLAVACAVLLPLTHLMTLAMILPVGLHILLVERRSVWKYRWTVLVAVGAVLVAAWPYWVDLYHHYRSSPPLEGSLWKGWVFPLLGGNHLAAAGLPSLLGDDWIKNSGDLLSPILSTAIALSLAIHLAVWAEMCLAVRSLWKLVRRRECQPVDHIAAIALGAWICQTLLDGTQRAYGYPHYYNATWIAYALFAWLAIQKFLSVRLQTLALGAPAAFLALLSGYLAVRIHHDDGTRTLGYGATLANQMAVEQELEQFSSRSFSPGSGAIQYPPWRRFPWAIDALRELRGVSDDDRLPDRRLIVRYRNAFPGDARIMVEVLPQ